MKLILCKSCNTKKRPIRFYTTKTGGLSYYCRLCHRAKMRLRYKPINTKGRESFLGYKIALNILRKRNNIMPMWEFNDLLKLKLFQNPTPTAQAIKYQTLLKYS